jgi:hypothetical protein
VLTLALPVATAAPVGGDPGTTQLVWHDAACELQAIMQLVTVDVCAKRILAAAATPANPSLAEQTNKTAIKIAKRRMTALPGPHRDAAS